MKILASSLRRGTIFIVTSAFVVSGALAGGQQPRTLSGFVETLDGERLPDVAVQ